MPDIDKDYRDILIQGAISLGVTLTDLQVECFITYLKELKEWNKRINLTSLEDDVDIIVGLFLDSLLIVEYLEPGYRVLDLGSGAGFPGIPLKIVSPDISMVLVDSSIKRVSFQRHIIRLLGLKDISAIHGRAEELSNRKDMEGGFDMVVSRALFSIEGFFNTALPFLKRDGILIAIKGAKGKEELECSGLKERGVWEIREKIRPFDRKKTILLIFRPYVSRET